MDNAYISGILQGLNERRAAIGAPPLSLNASLSADAQAHAMRMAERGDKFHSGKGIPEDASYAHIDVTPSSIGAKASVHVPALGVAATVKEDDTAVVTATVVSVGIGAVRVGERVYTCIMAEETVEFQVKSPD